MDGELGNVGGWPRLVEQLLGRGATAATAGLTALRAAMSAADAHAAVIVEWVRERPSPVRVAGEIPDLDARPDPGPGLVGGRPIATARIDEHWDLIVARAEGAAQFAPGEAAAVTAVATLFGHAAAVGRREAAETLHRLTRELVGTLDLDRVLLTIANTAGRLLASEVAGVFLAHGAGEQRELRMRCVVGHRTPETARLRIRIGRGMAGKVLATGQPARVDDYATASSITKEFLGIAIEEGTQSGLGVPMRDGAGEIIGVLAAWRLRPSVYTDEDEALLVSLAGLAAIGLENARTFERAQRTGAQLEAARQELERRLAVSDEAVAIHRRLTAIAAAGHDLRELTRAVHDVVGGRVVLVPAGDRVPVRWPPTTGEPPRDGDARDLPEALRRNAGGAQWVCVAIEAAGVRHGTLYAHLPGAPRRRDVVTLEQSATICALLLGHEDAMAAATARLRSEFVWDLLEGRGGSDQDDAVRAVALGMRLAFPARLLLLRAQGLRDLGRAQGWTAEQAERNRIWWAGRIVSVVEETTGHLAPVAHRDEHVVALLPAADATTALAAAAVARCPFGEVGVHAGLSREAAGPSALSQALHEARVALAAADPAAGAVVRFDDLGVLQFLIAPSGAGDLRSFATGVLGPLVDYDRRHDSDLVATLDGYFENGCSVAGTARALQIHPKTLAYRLRRIRELAGLDLSDRQIRLDVELALRILGPLPQAEEA